MEWTKTIYPFGIQHTSYAGGINKNVVDNFENQTKGLKIPGQACKLTHVCSYTSNHVI